MLSKYIYSGVLALIVLAGAAYLYKKYRVPPKMDFGHLSFTNLDGDELTLQDFAGKPVVIKFFATWCGPCRKDFMDMKVAQEKLEDNDIVFLAVSEEPIGKLQKFETILKGNFKILKYMGAFEDLSIHKIPTTYVLNADGKLIYQGVDSKAWHTDKMMAILREAAGI